jgi:hypothetical protein
MPDQSEVIKELLAHGKIVYAKARTGKTLAIVKLMLDHPDEYVVCVATYREARIMQHMYRSVAEQLGVLHYGSVPKLPVIFVSTREAENAIRGTSKKLLVDNLSHCFSLLHAQFTSESVFAATEGLGLDSRIVVLGD